MGEITTCHNCKHFTATNTPSVACVTIWGRCSQDHSILVAADRRIRCAYYSDVRDVEDVPCAADLRPSDGAAISLDEDGRAIYAGGIDHPVMGIAIGMVREGLLRVRMCYCAACAKRIKAEKEAKDNDGNAPEN